MPWFHVLKASHEQQNTPDYLKKEIFLEKFEMFLKYVKKKRYSKESGYRNNMSRALKPNVRRIRTTIFCSLDSTM